MPSDSNQPSRQYRVLPYFLKVFLPLGAALAAALLLSAWFQQRTYLREVKIAQRHAVQLEREVLEANLKTHVADTIFLADLVSLAMTNPGGRVPVNQVLERAFLIFANKQELYDQVRLLDASGREVVRVNHGAQGPWLAPADQLQDKRGRYYFKRSIALKPGEVYISPFDLNIEHGQIERPFKPTLRFATPVRGLGGTKRGVVVLNFLGNILLQRLRQASQALGVKMYLINRRGWWLVGPGKDREWGFMLPQRSAYRLGAEFPRAWAAMQKSHDGQALTSSGLFTFQVVRILEPKAGHYLGRVDDQWRLVSRVPSELLIMPWWQDYLWSGLGGLILLALLALVWALSRARRARSAHELQRQQARLQAISDTAQDAVTMVDAEDKVQFWNRAAERLFGYSQDEAMGQKLHRLVTTPEMLAKAHQGMALFSQTGKGPMLERPVEVTAQRKDGSSFPAEVAISAFRMDEAWYAAGNVRDITERKQAERELERLANTDGLTGALNRRRFMEMAQQELARSQRYGRRLSLLMLDLDHFKAVNDTYGHEAGDRVLIALVAVCHRVLRTVDIFGRMGGEEFMALLPETDLEGALRVAERVRSTLAEEPMETGGGVLHCTASLGVAGLEPGMDLEKLMAAADEAMYRAKQAGRNQVAVAGREPAE